MALGISRRQLSDNVWFGDGIEVYPRFSGTRTRAQQVGPGGSEFTHVRGSGRPQVRNVKYLEVYIY